MDHCTCRRKPINNLFKTIKYCINNLDEELIENSIKHSSNFTLISCASIVGRFCTIRLMLRNATYCISGSAERRVTRGGAIFLQRFRTTSVLVISSICWRIICRNQVHDIINCANGMWKSITFTWDEPTDVPYLFYLYIIKWEFVLPTFSSSSLQNGQKKSFMVLWIYNYLLKFSFFRKFKTLPIFCQNAIF